MATRLYLPSSGVSPLNALAVSSVWDYTGVNFFRAPMTTTKSNTALTDFTYTPPSTSGVYQMCVAQWVSPSLTSVATLPSNFFSSVVRGVEGNVAVDASPCVVVRIVNADGTIVRHNLVIPLVKAVEFGVSAATVTQMDVYLNSSGQIGDRFVVELGFWFVTPSDSHTATLRFGDPSSVNDFTFVDGLTGDFCPWVQFPVNLSFVVPPILEVSSVYSSVSKIW
jgi:hypothetical protein